MRTPSRCFVGTALALQVVQPATGQSRVPGVIGIALDSATSQPLAQVTVYTTSVVRADFTNETGRFRLGDVPPGTHVLTLRKDGFRARSYRFVVTGDDDGDQDLGPIFLTVGQEPTTRMKGTVSSVMGTPVERAAVMINGRFVAFSRGDGGFEVDAVEAGINLIQVRRIGYRPASIEIQVPPTSDEISVPISMGVIPVRLSEIVVSAERTVFVSPLLREFYQRRKQGMGYYFTRWEIEKQNPLEVTDLLRAVPGVRIVPLGQFYKTIRVGRGTCFEARPAVFLDGMPIFVEDIDLLVDPRDLHGVEVYRGIAGAPVQYSNSRCGVILLWTH